jgi:hypothetical protein
MKTLRIRKIGPISEATVQFGDLTVFVGPQASGKSIFLQWLKLVLDIEPIKKQLAEYGTDWANPADFLASYFGEGMEGTWSESRSQVFAGASEFDLSAKLRRRPKGRTKAESVFLAPAQRVLTLRDGWPRPFGDYKPVDPYVVRAYSEKMRNLMESEFGVNEDLFPRENRLKKEYRSMLDDSIFSGFSLNVERVNAQKRLVLKQGRKGLPYMVWSAGQREFIPLLLGLYWLMPSAAMTKREGIKWVILEEIEMGLHPRAVATMLALVIELLHRGYRVCLSTHSPQVLELVWAWQNLKQNRGDSQSLAGMLGVDSTPSVRGVMDDALQKRIRVYFFERNARATEISGLDPGADGTQEAEWGGLLSFSERANRAVAESAARAAVFRNSSHLDGGDSR